MKKYLLVVLLGLLTGFGSNAQQASPDKLSMKEELGLTKEVDAQVKSIKEEYKEKQKAVDDNATLDDKAKKAQKKVLMQEREEKINALLTKEQQAKYLEYKEKLKAQKEAKEKN